jgi:molybdopterin converting factor small subunit
MYFGRPSEFLLVTSERLSFPYENISIKYLLAQLMERGERWAYELEGSQVICTINEIAANFSDVIKDGDEIAIFSRKSFFEE